MPRRGDKISPTPDGAGTDVRTGSAPPDVDVVIPTRARAAYPRVALASVTPQTLESGSRVLVVLDGPDPQDAAVARQAGAEALARAPPPAPSAPRSPPRDDPRGDLVCFLDDDVEVRRGWLEALRAAD